MHRFFPAFTLLLLAGAAHAQGSGSDPADAAGMPRSRGLSVQVPGVTPPSAAASCAGGPAVWVIQEGRAEGYVLAGDPAYGATRTGRYLCRADADKAGIQVTHPTR